MNRWRTDVLAGRRLVAAALAAFFIGGWPHEGRAESQVPPSQVPLSQAPLAPTFSRAALYRIGDYIRNESATGKVARPNLPLPQHDKPVLFQSFPLRGPAPRPPT